MLRGDTLTNISCNTGDSFSYQLLSCSFVKGCILFHTLFFFGRDWQLKVLPQQFDPLNWWFWEFSWFCPFQCRDWGARLRLREGWIFFQNEMLKVLSADTFDKGVNERNDWLGLGAEFKSRIKLNLTYYIAVQTEKQYIYKIKRRHGWTEVKKIQTDCIMGFWNLPSLPVFNAFLVINF